MSIAVDSTVSAKKKDIGIAAEWSHLLGGRRRDRETIEREYFESLNPNLSDTWLPIKPHLLVSS